jgi:hypothetical protein
MRTQTLIPATILGFVLFSPLARAEKNADLKPTLVPATSAVVQENFDAASLPASWRVNKGTWQVSDGAVVGQEKPADMHAAVLTLARPFQSAAVRFSFRRDGATGFNLSFNHPKGHLFRIGVSDDGLTLTKDRDKNDPASRPQVLGKAAGKFPPGAWHTLLVEIDGEKVALQADNGEKLFAKTPAFNVEKTGYRFVTRGSSLLIDDVTIWEKK